MAAGEVGDAGGDRAGLPGVPVHNLYHFVVLPTPMEVILGSFYFVLLSTMFNLGMLMRICLGEVIDIVSVVTKLKVEIHRNIVLHVV